MRDKNPKLTRKEIEELAWKKGIKLTEDDIQKILNGDPEAMKKLKLNANDLKEIKDWWN